MSGERNQPWHGEVISEATETALRALRDKGILDAFYLARGTGLALELGHRLSEDLDFFALDLFNEESLLQQLECLSGLSVVAKQPHTLHVTIQKTKVSFLGYSYPVLFPNAQFLGVAVADPRDIACMKISAIASRGTKRDFVDLYFAAQEFAFSDLLQLFECKYAQTKYNKFHVLKSLAFFDDAEKDPMPHMLRPIDWRQVKKFFVRQASGRV